MNEKTLERIADALERIASAMTKDSKVTPMNGEILMKHIADLPVLSGRAKKVCYHLGIDSVLDLCGWTRSAIISQRGVGQMTFDELDRLLRKNGLCWGAWQNSPSYLKYGGGR